MNHIPLKLKSFTMFSNLPNMRMCYDTEGCNIQMAGCLYYNERKEVLFSSISWCKSTNDEGLTSSSSQRECLCLCEVWFNSYRHKMASLVQPVFQTSQTVHKSPVQLEIFFWDKKETGWRCSLGLLSKSCCVLVAPVDTISISISESLTPTALKKYCPFSSI